MTLILNRASRNYLWQHPWQLVLAVLGITLGVAVVISIDLALESSLQSFEQATHALGGRTSHHIIATDGGLDEKLYTRLRVEQGIHHLSPVVRGTVHLKSQPDETYRLYGVDPFIERSFRSEWQSQGLKHSNTALMQLMIEPNSVLISEQMARRLHLSINDTLLVSTERGVEVKLKVIDLLTAENAVSRQLMDRLIITDIATAQEVLGVEGKLSYIGLMIGKTDNKKAIIDRIESLLPAHVQLISSADQTLSMRQMTRAFSINLNALGLLSLLVGMFLIYNTMTFLVLQRRKLIGTLRSIGVTRRQIFYLIFSEALILAVIGTLIGIVVGIIIGQGLLQRVTATVDTLYFHTAVSTLLITFPQIAKGFLLGVGATILAVLPPAWEATRQPPGMVMIRSQLELNVRKLIKKAGWASLIVLSCGLILLRFSADNIHLGLAGIFLLLFSFALITPGFTLLVMKLVGKLFARLFGVLGQLPARMITADISRTGIAIAALMIAVAATIGMDLMINSFRETVSQWVKTSLRADLYVSLPKDKISAAKAAADEALKANIAAFPGVEMVSTVLHTKVISSKGMERISVFELNSKSIRGIIFKQQPSDNVWQRFEHEKTLLVTEPYAYFHRIKIGEKIVLHTDRGKRPFEVIGIYADYSGDRGHLAISRAHYKNYWPDLGYSGIGVYARSGTDLKKLENRIRKELGSELMVRSDQAIYQASMDVFEQTFAITETLRWLAAGIAFVGVFSALMALQFERTRQLGVLRAIGVTSRQLSIMITTETGLIGLVAGSLAIPVGYSVAYLLIFVIYQRAFGWTMAFYLNYGVFYQGLLLAFIAALLAGIFPALKMARTRPAEALRTE